VQIGPGVSQSTQRYRSNLCDGGGDINSISTSVERANDLFPFVFEKSVLKCISSPQTTEVRMTVQEVVMLCSAKGVRATKKATPTPRKRTYVFSYIFKTGSISTAANK
jgi:hypothetical protein